MLALELILEMIKLKCILATLEDFFICDRIRLIQIANKNYVQDQHYFKNVHNQW